jgi:hypothetical protein
MALPAFVILFELCEVDLFAVFVRRVAEVRVVEVVVLRAVDVLLVESKISSVPTNLTDVLIPIKVDR